MYKRQDTIWKLALEAFFLRMMTENQELNGYTHGWHGISDIADKFIPDNVKDYFLQTNFDDLE